VNGAGKAVGGVLGGNSGKEEKEEGRDEQLRLRLDLNLDRGAVEGKDSWRFDLGFAVSTTLSFFIIFMSL